MSNTPDERKPGSVAIVGPLPPDAGRIGTFTRDLADAMAAQVPPSAKLALVAVARNAGAADWPPCTRFTFAADVPDEYDVAAEFLHITEFGAVLLQYDFDVYGGPAGGYVLRLLRRLRVPQVVTLHTIPRQWSAERRDVVVQMAGLADRLVVPTAADRDRLVEALGVAPGVVAVIPGSDAPATADVAGRYLDLLAEVVFARNQTARRAGAAVDPADRQDCLPQIDLRHLRILTDGTGMAQHAVYATPDRRHGYCVDDNARALIVAMWYWQLRADPAVLPLAQTYLAFLVHAFNEDRGRFRNFMNYAREWLEEVGSEDAHARALMAMGVTANLAPHDAMLGLAVRLFHDALPALETFTSPRSWAFAIVGIDAFLNRFAGDLTARRLMGRLADRLMASFARVASSDWPWCENLLAWGNARIPHALLLAGARLDRPDVVRQARRTLRWLFDLQTAERGHLSVIGNQGWCRRAGPRAVFDQQPIEVMNLAEAAAAAHAVTREARWLDDVRRCLEWFLGRNDLGVPLYDPSTGGCRDGLHASGVNANQGAESTLAWLVTQLTVYRLRAAGALRLADCESEPIQSHDGNT